jgi:hypothetical protein
MKYSQFVVITLLFLLVIDSFRILANIGALNVDMGTYISAFLIFISIIILAFIAFKSKEHRAIPNSIEKLYFIWLGWGIFNLIRGAFLAGDYWDWKFLMLSSVPFTFISLVFFVGRNLRYARKIFQIVLRYVFPLGFLIIPLALATTEELYSRLMIMVSIFILFIPYVKYKWKIIIIIVGATAIFIAIGFRANLIKVAFSLLIIAVFYFRKIITQRWIYVAHTLLFLVPVIFVVLGATGKYNVLYEFSKNEGYVIENKFTGEERLTGDTRTFLYREVGTSLIKSGNWIIGEGASGKYQSEYFDYLNDGRGRYGSEVGILNILLYNGIIGVLIYFLLLFTTSSIAIRKSNNLLSKMIGLFIASRWMLSFIEEYTIYDLNFFFFWLIMGLVSSKLFRQLNDNSIRAFFNIR